MIFYRENEVERLAAALTGEHLNPWFSLDWQSFTYWHKDGGISYFCWWNWLPKHGRFIGFDEDWYDHPLPTIGFWFFNFSWLTPWSGTHQDSKLRWFCYRTKRAAES